MEKENHKLPKWVKITFLVILVPLILSLIANFFTWYSTKDKVEVTFKLDGWITIGSVKYADLPNLKLMLDQQEVKNISKVSWRVINTGNKGILNFESGPFIEFPKDLDIVSAKVSGSSPLLKVASRLRIIENRAFVDSLGMFNSGDFFKVDFYIKDVAEQNITSQYFKEWQLVGKTLDLSISQDAQQSVEASKKILTIFSLFFSIVTIILSLIIFIFGDQVIIFRKKVLSKFM